MNWLSGSITVFGVILLVGVGLFLARGSKEEEIDNTPNVYDADEDFELVDDSDLLSVRNDFSPPARKLWEELIDDMRKETGGVIRQGHLYWMIDVVVRGVPRHPIYKCDPPAGWKAAGES